MMSSPMNAWSKSFGGEKHECLQKMLPNDEVAGCRSGILRRSGDEGDLELFLCEADWIHLIHIQLGTLGLRE